jgi:ABC-type transport system involved in multi-copper enzyme maturation permease subunit
MNLTFDVQGYDWIAGLVYWASLVGVLAIVAFITVTAGSLVQVGLSGPTLVLRETFAAFRDFFSTSLGRIIGITRLTILEAIRRKALAVLVVFGVLFLFAGWFLTDSNSAPELQLKVHVSFVLGAISWLILPVLLLMSCWGLHDDIKNRSLHTVVTKPVIRHEIILGRILGYISVGAIVLAIMSVTGLIWLYRQIPEKARSQLTARVPVYGTIWFKNRDGAATQAGINTGDEWMFHSYIEGATQAEAVWDFEGVSLDANGSLELDSTFKAFRTHKGTISKEILGQMILCRLEPNPDYKPESGYFADRWRETLRVPLKPFENREFRELRMDILKENPKLTDDTGKPVTLSDVIGPGGTLRVRVKCLSGGQCLGMARPDLYVRLPDRPFILSYFKAILGIGLMMAIVITLAVCGSTFLKGPYTLIFVLFIVVVGRVANTFIDYITNSDPNQQFEWTGGGPIESLYRMGAHLAPTVPLEQTTPIRVIQLIDGGLNRALFVAKSILFPEFRYFTMTEFVANGFDVPWSACLLPALCIAAGYTLPWLVVAYFSLKFRELELK